MTLAVIDQLLGWAQLVICALALFGMFVRPQEKERD
jgi:hypothetical protein